MKHHFPVTLSEIRNCRLFLAGPINKEMPEAKLTRKKKATKKQLKALEQLFAK